MDFTIGREIVSTVLKSTHNGSKWGEELFVALAAVKNGEENCDIGCVCALRISHCAKPAECSNVNPVYMESSFAMLSGGG